MSRNATKNAIVKACNFEKLESRQLMSAAGAIDQTFGYHGYAGNPLGFAQQDMAVQADNKVLLVGQKDSNWIAARLNANGTVDTGFGKNGVVIAHWGEQDYSAAQSVAIQSDGKIIIGGYHSLHDNQQLNIVRLNTDGSFDKSFAGGTGAEELLGFQRTDGISDLAIQKDGKIVIASDHYQGGILSGDWDFLVGRLTTDGSWDSTFGDARSSGRSGYTKTGFGDDERSPVMTLQSDGKIILGGESGSFTDNYHKQVLSRYTSGGKLDSSFDGDGKLVNEMHTDWSMSALTVEPSGKILAVGSSEGRYPHDSYFFALERYNANGSVDQFSVDTRISTGETSSWAAGVFATQPGKFLVVGSMYKGNSGQTFAASFLDSGARDTSFGTNGIALYGVEGASSASMAPGGMIVASGSTVLERFSSANVTVSIGASTAALTEGQTGVFTFSRNAAYNFDTKIAFTTGGTATNVQDYTGALAAGTNWVTIPAGRASVNVPISAVDDATLEPNETLTVAGQSDNTFSFAKRITVIAHARVASTRKLNLGGSGGILGTLANTATISLLDNDTLHVNFQSQSNTTAAGYVTDTGAKFAVRGNGYRYGWDADNAANMRLRANAASPDLRYDSQALMQKNGANRSWELAVPNGTYEVRLVAGDPTATDSKYKMNLEGQLALAGNPAGDTHWFRSTSIVNVTDGRLTLTNAIGSSNNKIAFIDIKAAPLGATSAPVSGAFNLPVKLYSSANASQWTKGTNGLFSDQQIDDASIWVN